MPSATRSKSTASATNIRKRQESNADESQQNQSKRNKANDKKAEDKKKKEGKKSERYVITSGSTCILLIIFRYISTAPPVFS